ncbi:lasso peptide biosynthesis B2 protein [Spirosoma spitsbergense]|uniref:lasso peptide biosynthesis B2 protein n=1 Tax=Spirosoma spitsbergense TaxID=431554 RepID=UPI00036CBFF9|nr:lasso peptide biosynthesis B2 protein [Spirosoma spitsbergense]
MTKLWCLSWDERWLLLSVFLVLAAYKGLLVFLPFSRFMTTDRISTTQKNSTTQKKPLSDEYINKQIWAVRVISGWIPLGFTCLVQALGAKWLLKSHPDIRVCVGVCNSKTEGFSAHAWLTYQNRIILCEQTDQVFEPILAWT